MKHLKLVLVAFILAAPLAYGAVDKMVTVEGQVVSFDSKVVKVFNKGSISLAPKPKNVKPGQWVSITFNLQDFKKALKK